MASTISMPTQASNRPTYSCIRCADRKVKCDRQRPCAACVKHNVDCVFHPPRPRKRQRRVEQLTDRLRHYETLLQEQGIETGRLPRSSDTTTNPSTGPDVPIASDETQLQTPQSVDDDSNSRVNKTQVVNVHGRSKYLEK